MVTNIQQPAYCYYLFIKYIPYCKFKAVLSVYTHRRNSFLVTLQDFIVQSVISKQICYRISRQKNKNRLLVSFYHFRLVAVLLVARFPVLEQLAQVIFIELNIHNALGFLYAKLHSFHDIRKYANILSFHK